MTRSLIVAALLLPGCGLLAPFDLGELPPLSGVDADGDVDSDGDGDEPGDADPEIEPWEGPQSCGGEPTTDERWLVSAEVEGEIRSYVTRRDCADPELLCDNCYALAIAPTGDRALVELHEGHAWPLDNALAVVDLAPVGELDLLVHGSNAAWVDDGSFVYVAASEGWDAPCDGPGNDDQSDLLLYDLATGTATAVRESWNRAWVTCCPVPSFDGLHFGVPADFYPTCAMFNLGLAIVDREGHDRALEWTVEGSRSHFAFGRLPGGEGFLVQRVDQETAQTWLYAVRWDGAAVRVGELLEGVAYYHGPFDITPLAFLDIWGGCETVRRLGPACEIYCRHTSNLWWRYRVGNGQPGLDEVELGEPEPVSCTIEGQRARIFDVWQR